MKMKIKLLIMDVDGTLTDGKIYMSENGELMKAFDVKDGCGISTILPQLEVDWNQYNIKRDKKLQGILPVILTARTSEIVKNRCMELGITQLYQGCHDKRHKVKELSAQFEILEHKGIYEEIAYIGDDIIDLPAMKLCGFTACPSDAAKKVKEAVKYISSKAGGQGAVREIIEFIAENMEL